jgi:outer membrane receptor protein involved in Fe transport
MTGLSRSRFRALVRRIALPLVVSALPFVGSAQSTVPATQPSSPDDTLPTTAPSLPVVPEIVLQTQPVTTQVVTPAIAAAPVTQPASAAASTELPNIIVTSDLDLTRDSIAPPLQASTYTIGPNQIQNLPGGENASFQQVVLRAPGVVADSFGQFHVRGEHADVTYRINGVLLPEPVNEFAQEVDTRLINNVTLIDGSLPAQFGFRTAAVVDITTKSGDTLRGNELSLYGGSYNTLVPSIQLGGTTGKLDYFVTATHKQDSLGIENPTDSLRPLHDDSTQDSFFGYFSYRLDQTSRLSLLVNAADDEFELPDTPGLKPLFTLANHPTADSSTVNEKQNEQNYYTVVSYQESIDNLSLQISGFTSYAQIDFKPDSVGDLIFQGVAGHVFNSYLTNGLQGDASYILNDQHTVRFGVLADDTIETLSSKTSVFSVDPATGAQTSDIPFSIDDTHRENGVDSGVYAQDEWRLTSKLTFNYGARYDHFDSPFDHEGQLSPRAGVVYKIDSKTTAHAGYARYFSPPTDQYVGPGTLDKFRGTTNAPQTFEDDPLRAERSNYYDVGISRQITDPWTINFDSFYKQSRNLLDLGQFGDAVILSPFNYKEGTVYGTELSSTYTEGGLSAFGNFAWVNTYAHDIVSSQYQFDVNELDYISDHNIHLDHQSTYTASGGISYAWPHDRVYADFTFGSGLRKGFANLEHCGCYYPIDLGYEHVFHPNGLGGNAVRLRFDVVNVFDEVYQIRQGGGLGVEASQYGQRRSFYVGLAYDF